MAEHITSDGTGVTIEPSRYPPGAPPQINLLVEYDEQWISGTLSVHDARKIMSMLAQAIGEVQ